MNWFKFVFGIAIFLSFSINGIGAILAGEAGLLGGGYGLSRHSFNEYTVTGWKAIMMGTAWLLLAASSLLFFTLTEFIDQKYNLKLYSKYCLVGFGFLFCISAIAAAVNMFI